MKEKLYTFSISDQRPFRATQDILDEAENITEEEAAKEAWINYYCQMTSMGGANGTIYYDFSVYGEPLEKGNGN